MTIKLSDAMRRALKRAPNHWSKLSEGSSADALRKRGLVEYRDTPGETGIMAGMQWRITETGRIVDERHDDPDDDGGWDHRYEGIHTNRKTRAVI